MHPDRDQTPDQTLCVDQKQFSAAPFLVVIEAQPVNEPLRRLIGALPASAAFVVCRAEAGAHTPVVALLVASGAVLYGAAIDGEPVRQGHVYLLDQKVAVARRSGRFVLGPRIEGLHASDEWAAGTPRAAALTNRQREIVRLVVAGEASKRIAASLNISQRTVENHRAAIMRRLGVRTLADLVRVIVSDKAA